MKYLQNTSWLFLERILKITTSIVIGAWVARYLGVDNFGLLSYSNSLVALFIPVATFGLNDLIVKELLKKKYSRNEILGTSFVIKILGGVASFLFLLIYLLLRSQDLKANYLILLFSPYLFLQSIDVIDFFFQSQVLSKYVVFSRIIALTAANIVKVILIFLDASIFFFAGVVTFELLLILIFNIYFFQIRGLNIFSWRLKKDLAKRFLKNGFTLLISGFMYIIYLKIDQIMVREILGDKASGLYAVAIALSESWYFIPHVIATSFFPAILLSKTNTKKQYNNNFTRLYFAVFWIAVIIAALTLLFGQEVISVLYGKPYLESFNILKIYVWSNIFFFYATISSKWLVAEQLYFHSFYRNIVGAISNILLNLFLIKRFGLEGAAVSTLISYSFIGLFYDLSNKKVRESFRIKIKSIICLTE